MHAFAFVFDAARGCAQTREGEFGNGEGDLAFAGEHDVGASLAEWRRFGDVMGTSDDEQAGVELACAADDAVGLILTAPVEGGADCVVRRARELNAGLFVIARSHYIAEAPPLREAGADVVFSGEGEVALAITEFTLARLGAAPSRIEHERERVHQELARLGEGTRSGKRTGADKDDGAPRA